MKNLCACKIQYPSKVKLILITKNDGVYFQFRCQEMFIVKELVRSKEIIFNALKNRIINRLFRNLSLSLEQFIIHVNIYLNYFCINQLTLLIKYISISLKNAIRI